MQSYRLQPSTEEIVATRKKYGLTLHQMTLIMGFGHNQYSQYEKGQVPSESNGKLIRLAMKKENMMILLKESANKFDSKEFKQLKAKISASRCH